MRTAGELHVEPELSLKAAATQYGTPVALTTFTYRCYFTCAHEQKACALGYMARVYRAMVTCTSLYKNLNLLHAGNL